MITEYPKLHKLNTFKFKTTNKNTLSDSSEDEPNTFENGYEEDVEL